MSDFVTMGPCMANPEAFHSVDELRAELGLANSALFAKTAELHQRDEAMRAIGEMIGLLIATYHVNGIGAVAPLLAEMHEKFVATQPETH